MTDVSRQVDSFLSSIGIDRAMQAKLGGSRTAGGSWVTTEVKGLGELERALNQLPEKLAKGALKSAVTDATELFRARAVAGAPYGPLDVPGRPKWRTEHLRDGILKSVTFRSLGAAGAVIRGKIGLDKKHTFYGRFLEFGWITARGGRQVPARPFMKPAWEAMKDVALALFEVRLRVGVEAAARELHSQ